VNDAPVLLCDEPTAALDSDTGRGILATLRELARRNRAVAIVTHEERVLSTADRVVHVIDGRAQVADRHEPARMPVPQSERQRIQARQGMGLEWVSLTASSDRCIVNRQSVLTLDELDPAPRILPAGTAPGVPRMGDPDVPRIRGSGPPAPGEACREAWPAVRAPPRPGGIDAGTAQVLGRGCRGGEVAYA
jgi:hypothetical protein